MNSAKPLNSATDVSGEETGTDVSGEETEKGKKTVPKHKSLSYQLVCLIALILKTFTVSILTGTVVVCVLACGTVLLSLGMYCHLRNKSRQKTSTGK